MFAREEDQFVIVPIEKTWFDFHLEPDGKYLTLLGCDQSKPQTNRMDSSDTHVYFETEILIPCVFEYRRGDRAFNQILGEGVGRDGGRYLIIDRMEKYKP